MFVYVKLVEGGTQIAFRVYASAIDYVITLSSFSL